MSCLTRYAGEDLGSAPHIVVLGSCKVGNFVVSTPVLSGLRNRFPEAVIGFIGSDVTADFESAMPQVDWRCSWDDPTPGAGLRLLQMLEQQRSLHGDIQLALNLDGFNPVTCSLVPWLQPRYVAGGSLNHNRRRNLAWGNHPRQRFLADQDWDHPDFLARYTNYFRTNYIAELFCQLAWVHDHVDCRQISLPAVEPDFDVPDILIHCTTARAAKVWPFHHWRSVLDEVSCRGWSVGLVGSPPAAQRESYNAGEDEDTLIDSTDLIDLRGKTSLIQLAGACQKARAVVSVDAGPLHIAAAVGTATLGIVGNDLGDIGSSPSRLWMPRCDNFNRTISPVTCSQCADNRFRNDDCLVEDHPCMNEIQPAEVVRWLVAQLA